MEIEEMYSKVNPDDIKIKKLEDWTDRVGAKFHNKHSTLPRITYVIAWITAMALIAILTIIILMTISGCEKWFTTAVKYEVECFTTAVKYEVECDPPGHLNEIEHFLRDPPGEL
ncbi:hypothetical protein ES707_16042 [subsurface metagenome]